VQDPARGSVHIDFVATEGWVATFSGWQFSWPSATEAGRATLAWAMMNAAADNPNEDRALVVLPPEDMTWLHGIG
jgi:hypothetical protein